MAPSPIPYEEMPNINVTPNICDVRHNIYIVHFFSHRF